MHELSLVEGIRGILEEAAAIHNAGKIVRVRLEVGAFACVEREALDFAWEVVMRGSKAEGAALEITVLPGQAFCYDCMKMVRLDSRFNPCPDCGGGKLMPRTGDDLRIRNMEVA